MPQEFEQILSARFIAYADHWRTANTLLDLSMLHPDKAPDLLVASSVFRAFALESFLSTVASRLPAAVEGFERMPTLDKLKSVAKRLGLQLETCSAEWRLVRQLFQSRNEAAHAKDADIRTALPGQRAYDDPEALFEFRSSWQKAATEANCAAVKSYLERLMLEIWMSAGHMPESLFARGIQFWELKEK